ncbi:Hint domain-containing protein [Albirhodobacter sp. R86504]|jgi:hypothetical protein|uniref:Hint domain-containing protein n=1 Tax=Albirhodobacter sp. R86504 TaxID=3093848 RepID=UPI00366C1790
MSTEFAPTPISPAPAQATHVYDVEDIWVISGANQGDALGDPFECEPGDTYQLERDATPLRLMLSTNADGQQIIAEGSEIGTQGDQITLTARYVMMAPDSDKVDLLLIRHEPSGHRFALPLSPIAPRVDYMLIEAHEDPGTTQLADLVCVAFTTGTMITLAGGAQRPIESLQAGDRILTRDSGPQPLRLVAKATLRALGTFAPVVISSGTLGNEGDLVVSPHHRIFLYRRGERRIGTTSETLVQAKHLVDGENVWQREGGYVDYYALVFDRHEIIYAEGIPCESLMVSEATLGVLPQDLAAEVRDRLPGLTHRPHFGTEAGRDLLDSVGRDKIFRRRDE